MIDRGCALVTGFLNPQYNLCMFDRGLVCCGEGRRNTSLFKSVLNSPKVDFTNSNGFILGGSCFVLTNFRLCSNEYRRTGRRTNCHA